LSCRYEELNSQFDDFQKSSLEFEKELELQLGQSDEKIKELQNVNTRYSVDNDTLKTKLNELNTHTHKQISQLQEELAKFKAVRDEMQKYIRELEQKNDNIVKLKELNEEMKELLYVSTIKNFTI
jgi:predicted RNase H-like nuclease (RuvC/YqgF family)